MSKQNPTTGDLFFSEQFGINILITFTKYGQYWGLWATGQSFSCWKKEDFDNMIYLGKSKIDLYDLFEVKR